MQIFKRKNMHLCIFFYLPELFVIFLERTIISLLIVCPIAHLLF